MYWIFLGGAVIAAILGQTFMKAGVSAGSFIQQILDIRTFAGLGCYGASAVMYMVALRGIPISVALPATALSYVAVAAIGHFVFHEPIGAQKMAGLAMIMVGVFVLGTS